MRRTSGAVLAVVVLAAAGFALASIASGANPLAVLTGTTSTTETSTTETVDTSTTSTTESPGESGRRVTVCHQTESQKHPYETITVSWHAVHAVLKHGGHLGPCTTAEAPTTQNGKHDHQETGGDSSSQQAPPSPQNQGGHESDHGQSSSHGQGKENGSGHKGD